MNTFPELPAIFIIPQSERAAAWKGRKLTRQGSGFTGQKYRRGQYEKAAADIKVWCDAMKAALPVVEG